MSRARRATQLPLVIAELPPEAGELRISKADYYALLFRFKPLEVLLLLFFECQTRSAAMTYNEATGKHDGPRPKFARPTPEEMVARFRCSERTLDATSRSLEKKNCLAREIPDNKTHRGGYRPLPENYRAQPLLVIPEKKNRKAKDASVRAPAVIAAMEIQHSTAAPPSQSAIRAAFVSAKVGRIVQQTLAKSDTLPSKAEVQYVQEVAKREAVQAIAEQEVVTAVAEAARARVLAQSAGVGRQDLPNSAHLLALITPPAGATSATCCAYGWPCPLFDTKMAAATAQAKAQTSGPSSSDAITIGTTTQEVPEAHASPDNGALAVWDAMTAGGGTPDVDVAEMLIGACRKLLRDATVEEIVWAIGERAMGARRKDNPPGYLLTVVPKLFPHTVLDRRKKHQSARGTLERQAVESAARAKELANFERIEADAQAEFDGLPEAEQHRMANNIVPRLKAAGLKVDLISREALRRECVQLAVRDILTRMIAAEKEQTP